MIIYFKIHPEKPIEKPHPTSVISSEEQKRPPWAQKDPLLPDSSIIIQSSEPKPISIEPIVHQVPHIIDRSTGQPLLVNIQPSQVANVVIPQGGTQALIFGDTNEPHISGQYFDDPSPYPEPEVGPGFVGIQKVSVISILILAPSRKATFLILLYVSRLKIYLNIQARKIRLITWFLHHHLPTSRLLLQNQVSPVVRTLFCCRPYAGDRKKCQRHLY